MYLYLYQSENIKRLPSPKSQEELAAFRETLVRKALRDYCTKKKRQLAYEALKDAPIKKEPKGKPYFADAQLDDGIRPDPVHFSVSHSGAWWGCLMADEPVGFDMEVCRDKVNYEKIAGRFFTAEERDWILSMGREAFFEVWVRKEAFVKYLGTGLGEELSSFTVIGNGMLKGEVFSEKDSDTPIRRSGFILPCVVAEGLKAAYCSKSGDRILGTIRLEMEVQK